MSIQRDRSPSIRSRHILVKVSHASKRLPQDFFLPKQLSRSPKKRQSSPDPQSALKNWYEREDSTGKSPTHRLPIRAKQLSRRCLVKQGQESAQVKLSERENYYKHLLDAMQRKQSIIFRAVKEIQDQTRPSFPTAHQLRGRESREAKTRTIKSEEKRQRRGSVDMSQKSKEKTVKKIRLSLKQMKQAPRNNSSQGRYSDMNVGFDGLLTFNRFN